MVGVRRPLVRVPPPPEGGLEASPARVISVLLNSIFLDAIDTDYDQLKRINKLIENLSPEKREGLRPIKVCIVRPSENLGAVAAEMADEMPAVIRHFVAGLGSRSEASDLISYLLFEPCFTHWLMDLGYRDVMAQRDEIVEFYSS